MVGFKHMPLHIKALRDIIGCGIHLGDYNTGITVHLKVIRPERSEEQEEIL